MLDSLGWYFANAPTVFWGGGEVILTFYSTDLAQQLILWINEGTRAIRELATNLDNISYAYSDAQYVVLVQYETAIADTFRRELMTAHRYYLTGYHVSSDTLLCDTIGADDIFTGVAFDVRDGGLLAASTYAHTNQYPTEYYLRLVKYHNSSGFSPPIGPWLIGAPPERGYLQRFSIKWQQEQLYVLGMQATHMGEVNELRFTWFNRYGPSDRPIKTILLDAQQLITGFDMHTTDDQIYVAYTAASFSLADTLRRGAYILGFPLSDLFDAAEPTAVTVPHSFSLTAYPNPFNAATRIAYSLPVAAPVNLNIYDITGRQAAVWNAGLRPAGEHSFYWSADDLPSGIYFARLSAGSFSTTHKLVLLK